MASDLIPTRYEALIMVRQHFATEEEMAQAFGTTQPTIWRWLNQSRQMPAEKVLLAEELTEVPAFWLRPDIYPRDRLKDRGTPPDRFVAIDLRAATGRRRKRMREAV